MASGEHAAIDLSKLRQVSGNDPAFIADILGSMVEALPGQIEKLTAAARDHDWPMVKHMAHRLQSTTTFAGSAELQSLLVAIETEAAGDARKAVLTEHIAMAETRSRAVVGALREMIPPFEE